MPLQSISQTVFVVDDDLAVLDSLHRILGSTGWTVETYSSAQAFLDAYDRSKVGCLLLDLRMPGLSGIELLQRLQADHADLPVIMLTAYGDVSNAVRAIKEGAFEFLEKPVRAAALIEVVKGAIELHIQRRRREGSRTQLLGRIAELSRREREVFELLIRGKAVKEIAQELRVDPKTVHTHRARVLEKLGAKSNTELALMFAGDHDGVQDTSAGPISSTHS